MLRYVYRILGWFGRIATLRKGLAAYARSFLRGKLMRAIWEKVRKLGS